MNNRLCSNEFKRTWSVIFFEKINEKQRGWTENLGAALAAVIREKRIFRKTKRYGERLDNLYDVAANEAGRMMSYIYANYDAFKLIACCSEGAEYADYVERLIDIETKSGIALIHKMQSEKNACALPTVFCGRLWAMCKTTA